MEEKLGTKAHGSPAVRPWNPAFDCWGLASGPHELLQQCAQ